MELRTTLLSRRRAWLAALGAWLLVVAMACVALWQLRASAIDGEGRELELLSLALTEEIARALRGVQEGAEALRLELRQGSLPTDGEQAQRALKIRADLMPLVRDLWLLAADGHVVASSEPAAPPQTFVPPLTALDIDDVALSRPFPGAADGERMVAVGLRVGPTGQLPGGWIVASVPAREWLGAVGAALPTADARMAVVRGDGVVLAGSAIDVSHAGPPSSSSTAQRFEAADGDEQLLCRHRVERFGISVLVTQSMSSVLADWHIAAELTLTALVLLLLVMTTALGFVLRAESRRTEAQQALQLQLARSGKLQALGTLAGGVAHDFNNLLAGIVGYTEMAQDAAAAGSDQARHLERVMQAALRGKALVERILAFSRGGARTNTLFDAEPVIQEVLSLLGKDLRPGIVLDCELASAASWLRGDPTQLFEALSNLCTNALQAMPDGGVLGVRLRHDTVTEPRVLSHSQLASGEYLVLSVADQGPGISPDVMEHLFEPFFTTRRSERGTGLGLAVVHGVVNELRGAIDVRNLQRRGACFTLYLPLAAAPAAAEAPAESASPRGGGQRVLVVDDEPELVQLAVQTLQALGYAAQGCSEAAQALRWVAEQPDAFACVLSDERMPQMSGTELAQALRRAAPGLPVLLVSGFGGATLAARAAEAGVHRVLGKPLRRAELAQAVADAIAGPRS